ncbi:MAG TPA: metal-dependent hydrolase [Thermoanaerobaculia bacterium]|nr:metal-dependent hydrolase [Thermoanaerobaculia bacterium]
MDPLTHTLVGANLAATSLGTRSRLAAAACVIGANAPDIDAILYLIDDDLALGWRRGWTHGVLALGVLPLLLTGGLILYDRLRPDPTRPVDRRWLLFLSVISVLTHPTLDWLNTYGMRWLMPFDGTWFYGDAVFIMDPWLWLVLGAGWLVGRRATPLTIGLWLFFTLYIGRIVARRSPEYLIVIGGVAIILLAALVWRGGAEHAGRGRRFAARALAVATLYIGSRLALGSMTAARAGDALARQGIVAGRLMVSPHPIDPFQWDFVAEAGEVYRYGRFRWLGGGAEIDPGSLPVADDSPYFVAALEDPSVRGFATWVRVPSYEIERAGDEIHVHLLDARRARRGQRGGFGTRVVVLPAR